MTHPEQIQEILDQPISITPEGTAHLDGSTPIAVPPELWELVEVTLELATTIQAPDIWDLNPIHSSDTRYCITLFHYTSQLDIAFAVHGFGTPREALAEARARYAAKLAKWEASNGTPGR